MIQFDKSLIFVGNVDFNFIIVVIAFNCAKKRKTSQLNSPLHIFRRAVFLLMNLKAALLVNKLPRKRLMSC